jgi:hypothetical protein
VAGYIRIVAGYIPWRICQWHGESTGGGRTGVRDHRLKCYEAKYWSTVAGNILLEGLGNALYCVGSPSPSGLLRTFRPPSSGYARTDLPHAVFGCQRLVSMYAEPYVRGCPVADLRSRARWLLAQRGIGKLVVRSR